MTPQNIWIYAQKMPDETWRFGMKIGENHITVKDIFITVPVRTKYADKSPHLYLECEGTVVISDDKEIAHVFPNESWERSPGELDLAKMGRLLAGDKDDFEKGRQWLAEMTNARVTESLALQRAELKSQIDEILSQPLHSA